MADEDDLLAQIEAQREEVADAIDVKMTNEDRLLVTQIEAQIEALTTELKTKQQAFDIDIDLFLSEAASTVGDILGITEPSEELYDKVDELHDSITVIENTGNTFKDESSESISEMGDLIEQRNSIYLKYKE